MTNDILRKMGKSPSFMVQSVPLTVCPSLVLLALLMLMGAGQPLAGVVLLALAYLGLWLGKLRVQLWLAHRLGLAGTGMQLAPFVARVTLDKRGARDLQRDVHVLGLAVLFGGWAVLSLLALVVQGADTRWMLENVSRVALISGVIALVPFFGLEGGQILRLTWPNGAQHVLLGLAGQALAALGALVFVLAALLLLSKGKGTEALTAIAVAWACARLWVFAGDFSTQADG
jgi:hypothetical protein